MTKYNKQGQEYGGPQHSYQNQMLTANSNRSQQIQIAYSKFKSPTANSNRSQQIQIAYSKFKSLTANSNRLQQIQNATANSNCPQQIQIAYSKLKSLAANSRVCLFGEGIFSSVEGPYFTLKNVWKSVKRVYIKFAHRAFSIVLRDRSLITSQWGRWFWRGGGTILKQGPFWGGAFFTGKKT